MDNKIDINYINKKKGEEHKMNDITNKLESIDISPSLKSIKIKPGELEDILNTLQISNNPSKKKDIKSLDKSSYEYRSKYLKRKLNDTGFYSILSKQPKYCY